MPTITDWLMVVITAVYVVATIAIFVTNKKSEKAAYAQLEETKRQYEDKKRLEIMPYLQFEHSKGNPSNKITINTENIKQGTSIYSSYPIEIINIGNGTAKEITYSLSYTIGNSKNDDLPKKALQSGMSMSFTIDFLIPENGRKSNSVFMDIYYSDLLNNHYSQKIEFFIRESQLSPMVYKHKTNEPKLYASETDQVSNNKENNNGN